MSGRNLKKRHVIHFVCKHDMIIFALVIDPNVHRVLFGGNPNLSEVYTNTQKQLQQLFRSCESFSRRTKGADRVTAIVIHLIGGTTIELHPDCVSAADAYEAHVAKPRSLVAVSARPCEVPDCF